MEKTTFCQPARIALLCLSFFAAFGLHCNPIDDAEDVREHFAAELLVRGTVVDEDGVPLDRVEVTIETTVVRNPGQKTKSKNRTKTISRTFEIYRRSCTSATVYFCKQGFYCDQKWFRTTQDDCNDAVDLVKEDVVATLYRIVPQVDFMLENGSLTFGYNGVREVLKLPGDVIGALPNKMGEESSSIDTPFVYIIAPKDGTKEIFQHQPGSKRSEEWFKPRGVRIVFTNPDDGVVPFLFGEKASLERGVLRRMRMAPLDGYQRAVELEEMENSRFFFYCRVNGLYGRGFAGAPILSGANNDLYISVPIRFYLNGNGSRDFTKAK